MNLYNNELRNIVRSIRPPHSNFILEIYQTESGLGLRFFIDNYDSFSRGQQKDLSLYVSNIRNKIIQQGITCEVEAV